MRYLLIGGTFDDNGGKSSKIIGTIGSTISSHLNHGDSLTVLNGGDYSRLSDIINVELAKEKYDAVFWFPNVDNSKEKVRNVKEILPTTLLVTSKRNEDKKYTFLDLEQRALEAKANLLLEFAVDTATKNITFNVMDPLGNLWYTGTTINDATKAMLDRLSYLKTITRQQTIHSDIDVNVPFNWYFKSIEDTEHSNNNVKVPNKKEFIDIVHKYADIFHTIMFPETSDVKRFLGNCSTRLPKEFRCPKGFPSFREKDYIFVSRRNVNKESIDMDQFVPVYMEDDKLYYCGDYKPSVDAPVQVRLYQNLPNINYIIHSHCYINDAPFTSKSIPCGALEEEQEVLSLIDKEFGSRELNRYAINLLGHGSLIMGSSTEDLKNVEYIARQLPEITN